MPGSTVTPEIELTVEERRPGGGGGKPPEGGDGGGDDGGGPPRGGRPSSTPGRYSTAVAIGIVSISMFFMALASAFIILRRGSEAWVTVHLPRLLWLNNLVLFTNSFMLGAAQGPPFFSAR